MKLLVMDGDSIVNRAYYGIRPLSTKDGLYTHDIYGFLMTIQRFLEEEQPQALCIAFDLKTPTFRHQEYEDYKEQRKSILEELSMQMPVLKQVLAAMNIPYYQVDGYEADDLIGMISRRCQDSGWDCVIATDDKDSLRLITEHVKVKLVTIRMGQIQTKDMTAEAFREEYGFDPIHMIDLKALMGDHSDNIPGVPGIGEKTAMALIQSYGSIDRLYAAMPDAEAKPAVLCNLQDGRESAYLSRHLATIITYVSMDFQSEENLLCAPSEEPYSLFLQLEFTKLIDKMELRSDNASVLSAKPAAELTVTCCPVTTRQQAQELLAQFRKAEYVTLLALPDLFAIMIDCDTGEHSAVSAGFFFSRYEGDWNLLLKEIFSADIKKVSYNIKDLIHTLLGNDLPAGGFIFDVALVVYLVDATAGKYDLAALFASYFHQELPEPLHREPEAFSLSVDALAAETAFYCYTSAVGALYEVLMPLLEERQLPPLY